MRAFLAAICLVFSLSTANATYTISTIDTGGNIMAYIKFWKAVGDSGEKVIIDAPCISACSFLLGLVQPEKVCITPKGSLGLHMVNDGKDSDPVFSKAFYRWMYPQWVQQWIKDNGGLKDDPIYMYPEDMKGHINLCPGYEYSSVAPDDLIGHEQPPPSLFFQQKPPS